MTETKNTPVTKYQHLYGSEEPTLAIHFMISNQRSARQYFKEKWVELVPLMEVHIGKLLKSKLSNEDILIRREAFSYYLICAGRDSVEASSFCERLAAHVFEKVFSPDPHLQELQVSLTALSVGTKNIHTDAALKETLFKVRDSDGWGTVISRHNFAACKPEQIDHSLVRQIAALRGVCDKFFSSVLNIPETDEALKQHQGELEKVRDAAIIVSRNIASLLKGEASVPVEDPISYPTPAPMPQPSVSVPVDPQQQAAEKLQLDLEKQIGPDAELAYYPVWDVPRQVIDKYRCSIIRHLPSGDVEVNSGAETQHASHVVDKLIVRKVLLDISIFAETDSSCLVIMPLHANTILSGAHFQEISTKLKPLSIMERKQLLINIIGITEYTTQETINKLMSTVKPYCASVSFRITGANHFSDVIKKSGGSGIGLHMDDVMLTTADLGDEITRLAVSAEQFKMASFAQGVHTVALAATAIGAGITFISGDAIGNPLELPWGSLEFKVESLYSKVISG